MKPTRRTLLIGGAATIAAPPLAFVGLRGLDGPEQVIAGWLRRALPGLAVAEPELLAFARTYLDGSSASGSRPKLETFLTVMRRPWLEPALPEEARGGYDWFTRELLTDFLFSTDFFTAAGQRPEKTRFTAFADPYAVGCRNPLANTDFDAA